MGPCLPVILVEGVLNRDDVVFLNVSLVNIGELSAGEGLGLVRVGVLLISMTLYGDSVTHLEVQVVLAVLVELGRGNVKTNLDLASVASLLDGLGQEVERFLGARNVGSETSFVTDVDG